MSEYTPEILEYGLCEFCSHPVEMYDGATFIRRKDELETRVTHTECWQEYLEEVKEDE